MKAEHPTPNTQHPTSNEEGAHPALPALLTVPPTDGNFKQALEDAPLEVLDDAMETAFKAGQKTRFKAIRAEVLRRYKESNFGTELPTWADMEREAEAKKIRDEQNKDVMRRAAEGNHPARVYRHEHGLNFEEFSRSERQNADGEKDCAGSPLGATAAVGDAPVGAGTLSPGVRTLSLDDLAVLPPVKRAAAGRPMPLPEIEDHIRGLDAKIADRTRGYHNEVIYDIVAKGLMLLKGRAVHLVEASAKFQLGNKKAKKNGGETVSSPSGKSLAVVEEKAEVGFIAWAESFPGQQIRTARNYMNAARNVGLTSDHGLEDVEALRVAMALHEKKPTDLYKLADKLADKAANETAPRPNLVAEVKTGLFAYTDQALQLRDETSPEEFNDITQRTKAFLEKFTGGRWEMVEASDDSAEHGDMHAAESGNARANKEARNRAYKKAKAAKK